MIFRPLLYRELVGPANTNYNCYVNVCLLFDYFYKFAVSGVMNDKILYRFDNLHLMITEHRYFVA